jgi:uncharacterized protein (TIGR02217 family)
MSLPFPLFPGNLIGAGWPVRKEDQSTIIQRANSGKEVRIAEYLQAYYAWDIPFGYLNDNYLLAAADYQVIMGFQELVSGRAFPFLYDDPQDDDTSQYVPNPVSAPTPSQIGIGDGRTTNFQLARNRGGFPHLVYYVNSANRAPRIYINNNLQFGGYTISTTGLVVFGTPPASGVTVGADFQFYYLCRFDEDAIEAENIAGPYHMIKSVKIYETFQ